MAMRPPPVCRACSPREMSPITCTVRPSPPQVPAAWPRSMRIDISSGSMPSNTRRARSHQSIDELDPHQWNALAGTDIPFLRHEFLAALEHCSCVGAHTGWQPRYITLSDDRGLAAAVPAFEKS